MSYESWITEVTNDRRLFALDRQMCAKGPDSEREGESDAQTFPSMGTRQGLYRPATAKEPLLSIIRAVTFHWCLKIYLLHQLNVHFFVCRCKCEQ